MFESLKDKLSAVFTRLSRKGKLNEADVDNALREVRRSLLEADVDFRVAKDLVAKIRERAVTLDVLQSISANDRIAAIVYEELTSLMGRPSPLQISPKPPTVILLVGLQGSGKTTSAVKLARHLQGSHKPLVVACDLRRPAAIEQLRVLAEESHVAFYGSESSDTDIIAVIKGAAHYAENHLNDVIILDTAGRLHMDAELMNELKQIAETLPPHEKLLVVDAMMGQEAVNVAKTFHELLTLTGLILTKLDGDTRGGSALSIRAVTGIPIKFAGTGEGTNALEPFNPSRMSGRIMGMGDLEGLAEKVKAAGIPEQAIQSPGKLAKQYTLETLLAQLEQIEQMGPLENLVSMIPGIIKVKDFKADKTDASVLTRSKAIIQSMTPDERRNPRIIKGSRRRRIAQGSGTSVQMVNQLLAQYEQMKKVFKSFSSKSGGGRILKSILGFGR